MPDKLLKIAVVGPGAIGCLLGAYLAQVHQVWLLDHNPNRASLLNQQGLILEKSNSRINCQIRATTDPQLIGPANLVLLCVKSGDTEEALLAARPLLDQDSLLLPFQNGIGHLSILAEIPAHISWGLGVTANGATLAGPGHVLHRGQGLTRIGLVPGPDSSNERLMKKMAVAAAIFNNAEIETELVPDILNHVWSKLLVNVGINALTAIHNCPNGSLLQSPEKTAIMEEAVREGSRVAAQIGITLADDPLLITKKVCQITAANISSMLQDVRAKRTTEIAAINGALIQKASALGIPTPVNDELVRKVRAIEDKYHDFT